VVSRGFYLRIYRHLVGLLGWAIGPDARPLPTHRTTQHIETQTHIHVLSRIWTCSTFEQPKTVLASDCS